MNKNNIVKPLTLLREDFVQNLAKLCNNSGLPFFVIESVLDSFIKEVHTASKKQYESDKTKYNQELLKLQSQDTPVEKDGD